MIGDAPSPLLVRRRSDDIETPISALLKLGAERSGAFLFESVIGGEQRSRYSVIGLDPDLWWRVRSGIAETSDQADFGIILHTSLSPIQDMRRFVGLCAVQMPDTALPAVVAGAYGYIGYDMARYMERLPKINKAADMPEALLMRPQITLIFDAATQEILLVTPLHDRNRAAGNRRLDAIEAQLDRPFSGLRTPSGAATKYRFTANTSRTRYHEMVSMAKAYILSGDILRIGFNMHFSSRFTLPPIALYRSLRRLYPSPFLFFLNAGSFQLAGAEPGATIRVQKEQVTLKTLSGIRARRHNNHENLSISPELLLESDARALHLLFLDMARNDVGRVSEPGSLNILRPFAIEHYANTMHMTSHVEGKLRSGLDAIDALKSAFPSGTVSGAPKVRAMQIIEELETNRRGIHGGAIGYFAANGDMYFCISQRTATLRNQSMHVQIGADVGIDETTDKSAEYLEKAQALFHAAGEAARYMEQ